jgi:hypothetical protein
MREMLKFLGKNAEFSNSKIKESAQSIENF